MGHTISLIKESIFSTQLYLFYIDLPNQTIRKFSLQRGLLINVFSRLSLATAGKHYRSWSLATLSHERDKWLNCFSNRAGLPPIIE